MLKPDIAERIRAIFLHDGSAVTIVDFIILLGWDISTFEAAVKWGVITIEDPAAAVPHIGHAQLLEKARDQWSEAEIAEALGDDGPRVLVSTHAPAATTSIICDAVRAEPVDALQVVAAPSPVEMLAAGLRPPHREPVPRRRTRSRVPAVAPAPPLPPTRRNRADGVREATLTGFEVAYQDLVPMLRLRGRWLARNGFKIGARIYITVAEGRIVITATDPAASAEPARFGALRQVAGALADAERIRALDSLARPDVIVLAAPEGDDTHLTSFASRRTRRRTRATRHIRADCLSTYLLALHLLTAAADCRSAPS